MLFGKIVRNRDVWKYHLLHLTKSSKLFKTCVTYFVRLAPRACENRDRGSQSGGTASKVQKQIHANSHGFNVRIYL